MARINTSKTLHNSYFDGTNYDQSFNSTSSSISIHPWLESQYDFAITENQELLYERSDTAKIIHKIFQASKYNDGRFNVIQTITTDDNDTSVYTSLIRIPKEDIKEVFNYIKAELLKRKNLNSIELIIAINEYFDFNYDFVYKKVLSAKDKQELLEDYYTNEGMQTKMNESSSIKLF
jgi:hypothetical protein